MIDDVVARLRAALDETGRAAQEAQDDRESDWWWSDDAESPGERHIARHNPAAALRDVAADRLLLSDWADARVRLVHYERQGESDLLAYAQGDLAGIEQAIRRRAAGYGITEGASPAAS